MFITSARYNLVVAVVSLLIFAASTPAQSGGPFVIEKSVIAGGGVSEASGGQFLMSGTVGQPVAGEQTSNAGFREHAGFWHPVTYGTTAAAVPVGGRVLTASGQGIRNAIISLRLENGTLKTASTGSLGYYQFDEITAGQTILLTVTSRRFSFAQPSIVIHVTDLVQDADFIANGP